MKKVILLGLAIAFLVGGWLEYSYYSFQVKFGEKISARDLAGAKNLFENWGKTREYWVLESVPKMRQENAFLKGWLLSQTGDSGEAVKSFQRVGNHPKLGSWATYNIATLGLIGGRESLEKLAEEYIGALKVKPNDFQTKVNLEIVRRMQQKALKEMPAGGEGDKSKKKEGDEENQGQGKAEDQKDQQKDKGKEGDQEIRKIRQMLEQFQVRDKEKVGEGTELGSDQKIRY